MAKYPDTQIIDMLGGTAAVAFICNVKSPSVSEWRRVGIPEARRQYLQLLRPDIFGDPPTAAEPVKPNAPKPSLPGGAAKRVEGEAA